MSLVAGARLGPYEIVSALGAGGMGEVYRARDTKLRRDVAIKVLPEAVRLDPERLTRFEREARVLASLNHPNIAAIYGVEEAQGVVALVLELIDGDTLAARIARGPIAVSDALTIARQIAEALDTAHEKGVVHRDLKPANITITPTGLVKVLDFGLAKIAAPTDGSAEETQAIGATEGMVIGTAAYMSPEQARGQVVDRRSDIWSFGCVLYEMLTGERLFSGSGTTDTLALVFTKDPDWNALPPLLPPAVRALLKRCLERDRLKRIGDVAAIRFALEDVSGLSTTDHHAAGSTPSDVHGGPTTRRWLSALVVTAIGVGLGAWYLARFLPSKAPTSTGVTRLTFVPEGSLAEGEGVLALSPDGRRLAYVAIHDGRQQLYLQELDQFAGKPIPGTEGATCVTFSSDGNWLAFAADRKIRKIAVAGGEPVELGDFGEDNGASSMSWESNDSILFSNGPAVGIWRVPAAGGPSSAATTLGPGELEHHRPQLLPGGKALLYSATLSGDDYSRVVVQSFETGQRHFLAIGTGAQFIPPGYLAYVQAGTVYVTPFDLTRLETTGPPAVALQGVRMTFRAAPQIAYSRAGSMAYLPASGNGGHDTLVWVDRSGAEQPTSISAVGVRAPRLAPDLRRVTVALSTGGGLKGNQSDVWMYDITRNAPSRVTFEGSLYSVWSPDGTRLAYNLRPSTQKQEEIQVTRLGDPGPAKRLAPPNPDTNFPFSWSPDGRFIAGVSMGTANHVWVYGVDDPSLSRAFLQTTPRTGGPTFSPDGRWIAYGSQKSGRNEIYMSPFPGPGEEITISTDGGNEAVWARKAGQLFYRHGNAMMVVDVTTTPTPVVGKPRKLFEGPYNRSGAIWPNYDVSPDGQRFLMVKPPPRVPPTRINVVWNWSEELKRLAPAK
jgi:eukaryotic-like serine/threonine-protein kinase